MNTILISPDALDYLATSPQCVDNHFVPEKLFRRISQGKTTLKEIVGQILEEYGGDPFAGKTSKDANILLRTQKREYNRSLLYSKQIVVNRAAFWNTPALIVSALSDDVASLAELIRKKAIVPYLYKEHSFDEPPKNFDHSFGERAMKRLVDSLANDKIECVRLSPDDEKNDVSTRSLSTRFRTEITKWRAFEERENIKMISKMLLLENVGDETESLDKKIMEVAERIDELAKVQAVGREHIYQKFIVKPNTLVSHGIYRSSPLTFEIKKWIDSVYTTNLPNALNILTFTPEGFPTAYDLGMTWILGAKQKTQHYSGTGLFEEVVDRTKNEATWRAWNTFQKNANFVIPDPDQLSHSDILEIRSFASWMQMMDTLETFLSPSSRDGTLHYGHLAKTMWEAFAQFNRALEAWYLTQKSINRDDVVEKYAVGIGKILQLGEWMIGLLYDGTGTPVVPILPRKGVQPPPLDRDDLKFGIEVGLFFITQKGIDWKKSHLVQKMGEELKVSVDEVRKMIKQISSLFPEVSHELRLFIDNAPALKPSQIAESE